MIIYCFIVIINDKLRSREEKFVPLNHKACQCVSSLSLLWVKMVFPLDKIESPQLGECLLNHFEI